ncbi:ATP-binding cassette domain-containing protein [Thermosphaera chiliense]|nr:ABC transporter ATP-binding protein [Thermosphaera aggregans]
MLKVKRYHAMQPVIDVEVSEAGYPGGFTIRNIEFELYPGELLVIAGESGSGKTTLVRVLTGTIGLVGGYFKGKVLIRNTPIDEISPDEFYSDVAYIPQEPWFALVGYSVETEYCHSLAVAGYTCEFFDLMKLGLGRKLKNPTYGLSAGETQRLIWAESLARSSSVFILDEPLVYIDKYAREMLHSVVETALKDGKTVVVVDHNPLFWRDLASKIIYLHNGQPVYSGHWRNDFFSHPPLPERGIRSSNEFAIRLENIWFKYPGGDYLFKDFSLSIKERIITGLTGPNGSGKSTLLKIMAGVLKPSKGRVVGKGKRIYIPENPLIYFTKPTPWEELLYASGGNESKLLDIAERFNLKNILHRPLARLSSGERRRVALASAFLSNYQTYLLDEPTAGLDDVSSHLVLEHLIELAESGLTIIVSTHDERVFKILDETVEVGGK